MKVLYCKTFGLGNAIMAIPALKAIKSIPDVERLDVLIGGTKDDPGAFDVFARANAVKIVDDVIIDSGNLPLKTHYDVAIMAIPYDGRWLPGIHFTADCILDGRPRPNPNTTGLISWEKHEIEYQMENAYELGFDKNSEIPDCSFTLKTELTDNNNIYLGIGFKKDASSFWSKKHWGTENYIELVKRILDKYPDVSVCSTGDILDWNLCLGPMKQEINDDRLDVRITDFSEAFKTVQRCKLYLGNDTGMMHVAASFNLDVMPFYFMERSHIKNSPWVNYGSMVLELFGVDKELTVNRVMATLGSYYGE